MGFVLALRNLKHKDNNLLVCVHRELGVREEVRGISCPLHDARAMPSSPREIPCLETSCRVYGRAAEPGRPAGQQGMRESGSRELG